MAEKGNDKKGILEEIIQRTAVSVVTILIIGGIAYAFRAQIAGEISNSIQQNRIVGYFMNLNRLERHEEVISGIDTRLKQSGLYPATKNNLMSIRESSQAAIGQKAAK